MTKLNKEILIVFFFLAVFFLAAGVWYSPTIFKGFPIQTISSDLLLAKNYSLTGILATQDKLNVVISSDLVKDSGYPLSASENLRSIIFAKIFDIFGIPSYNRLILFSVIIYSLILLCFTGLIIYLFNFKTGAVFSFFYIFSPLGWSLSRMLGVYEFCLLFWALFFIFYFWGIKKEKSKLGFLLFIISGIFLALSGLSKEVTFVFAVALFVFLLFKKLKRQLIYIFVPFVIILMIFWFPAVLKGENRYLGLFGLKAPEKSVFSVYMHVFPDPYTYHFEKEQFLEQFRNQDLGWSENLQTKKTLTNFGFEKIGLFERIKVGSFVFVQHLSRFFSLEELGGPLIALLLILGIIYLKTKNKFLYQFSINWLIISFLIFSFLILVGRSHLMDFVWLLALLMVLGLFYIFNIFKERFNLSGRKSLILGLIIIGSMIYHLILVNHVVLGKLYDKDAVPRSIAYSDKIKDMEIKNDEVIAVPNDFSGQIETLNYLTNKSLVVFRESTLDKLLKENKIKQAFEIFRVKYILGYSDEISDKITTQTKIINIASSSLKIDINRVSANKGFFMNLIR